MATHRLRSAWVFLALLALSAPARSILIDDFENGPVSFTRTARNNGTVFTQTGLPPAQTVGGSRRLSAFTLFGSGTIQYNLAPSPADDAMSITFGPGSQGSFADVEWGSSPVPLHANLRPDGPGSVRIAVTFSSAPNAGDDFLVNILAPGSGSNGIGFGFQITGPGQYISQELFPFELDILEDVGSIRFSLSNRTSGSKTYSIAKIEVIPEPATAGLLGLGLAALAGMRRTRAA